MNNHSKKYGLICVCMIIRMIWCCSVTAQSMAGESYRVTGRIAANGEAVPQVTVLLCTKDSVNVSRVISNNAGEFILETNREGNYSIIVRAMGYREYQSSPFALNHGSPVRNLPVVELSSTLRELKTVDVKAAPPILNKKADRLVVNIERTAKASGENVLELLKDLPGITVGGDETIAVNGKTGVSFMIDGRKVLLSGDQLKNLLKNTYSDRIRNIEIIYVPPAQYDAEGTGGLINIVTKKPERKGSEAGFFTRYSQGIYGSTGLGMNIATTARNISFFMDADYSHSNYYSGGTESRLYASKEGPVDFRQGSFDKTRSHGPSAKAGIDWQVDTRHSLGIQADINTANKHNPYVGRTEVYAQKLSYPDSSFNTQNLLKNRFWNVNTSLSYLFLIDTLGQKLTFNYDFSYFDDRQELNYGTAFLDSLGHQYRTPEILKGNNPTVININTVKLDYSWHRKGIAVDAGVKSSFINTANDIRYYQVTGNEMKPDPRRTNTFNYREHIHAFYVSVNKGWNGFSLQAGLRGEKTDTRGNSVTLGSIIKRSYFKLFPSLFLQKELKGDNIFNISYSRRIQRPDYSDLNPFEFYFDPYSYVRGNPYLNPEYSNAFELSYTFRSRYIVSLGYTSSRDVIGSLSYQNDTTKMLAYVPVNLRKKENLSLSLLAPVSIRSWWDVENSFTLYNNRFISDVSGTALDKSQSSYKVTVNNNFIINAKTSVQLTGSYNSASLQGIIRYNPRGSIDLSVKRTLFNKSGTLRVAVSDLLRTDKIKGATIFSNQHIDFSQVYDSRKVTVSFSINLHKGKKVSESRKEAGNEDEKGRVTIGN